MPALFTPEHTTHYIDGLPDEVNGEIPPQEFPDDVGDLVKALVVPFNIVAATMIFKLHAEKQAAILSKYYAEFFAQNQEELLLAIDQLKTFFIPAADYNQLIHAINELSEHSFSLETLEVVIGMLGSVLMLYILSRNEIKHPGAKDLGSFSKEHPSVYWPFRVVIQFLVDGIAIGLFPFACASGIVGSLHGMEPSVLHNVAIIIGFGTLARIPVSGVLQSYHKLGK